MQNLYSLPRITVLALALGTASISSSFAQTAPNPAPTTPVTPAPVSVGKHHHHDSVLTTTEKAQLDKAKTKVLATNSALATESAALKQQHKAFKHAATVSVADQQAYKTQKKEHKQKMEAAILKVDPTLGPIFAKLSTTHKHQKA